MHQALSAGSGTVKYDSSTWWVANLAKRIAQGGATVYSDFWYGAGRERIRQFAQKSATTSEATSYVGGLYEKFVRNASGTVTTEHVHYVRGGGSSIAVVKRIAGVLQTRYLHKDHLGSVVALSDSGGAVLERYSYDPWGKRRDAATWVSSAPGTFAIDPAYTDRGFTGHEHVEHVGLVNMNGRIYDPELGKFLSADPTTQFPESTQGWNRYAYTGNNPLSYTDPSGFSFLKTLMQVVGIVLNFIPVVGQFASAAWYNAFLVGFASGFLASGGNLKAGLLGGLGGVLFGAISNLDQLNKINLFEKSLLHGLTGGTLNALGGGKFQDGFLGAFSAAMLSPGIEKTFGTPGTGGTTGKVLRVASAAVIGGVSSVLGGGKFKNGAVTAAFARLFNDEGHPASGEQPSEVAAGEKIILLKPDDPNYQTAVEAKPASNELLIIGHGNEAKQTLAGMNAEQAADFIRTNTSWRPGMSIKVDACWLGNSGHGFAQQLSNRLAVTVIASPVRTLSMYWGSSPMYSKAVNSSLAIPLFPSGWRTFEPKIAGYPR